ncbi:MAG: ATP-binding cassette domain-containing protein [Proteobacteria bacterium]|nr:ATP-binding cassette domain-containing protein [Pseudomonadota bacterium]MBU2226137.1 ATP-binding cassette domain-containing protein [Pseudomonadota bacterium]MBU2262246.1 ATP-binding cassette domain-containing protein [Pseudomonadota bacterium]
MDFYSDKQNKRLITLEDVTLRLGGKMLLPGTSWEIRAGENWAILGPNGSGKSALARAIKGEVPHVRGKLTRHEPEARGEKIGYVSFELQEQILLREDRLEEARFFSGGKGHSLTAGDLLRENDGNQAAFDRLVDTLKLRTLLGHGIRTLSNGETRKLFIARALLPSPKILILDDPFAGLDVESRKSLASSITEMMEKGTQMILVTHRIEEVIPGVSHLLVIQDGRVVHAGTRSAVITPARMKTLAGLPQILQERPLPAPDERTATPPAAGPLVEMKNIHVAYGDLVVIEGLNWTVRRGEHWAVVGPNGSGKTTLLGLITGDNLQVYANEVFLFGKKRGEGESIWEIRRRIGLVSPELQFRYRRQAPVREVVLSGFFDSIGLYRQTNPEQEALADRWLECLGLQDMAYKTFSHLSYGEKRLALIVRAMVKSPELLLLDEPCQGLDRANREMVLALLQNIGRRTATGLIYVTHHEEEMIPCIDHCLKLGKAGARVINAPFRTASAEEGCRQQEGG